ncbi:MAG: hypothetical protein KGJ80_10315 [Chloroflexota bacterium]|nr:hypothetical protein [Chloroflexota bacterium]
MWIHDESEKIVVYGTIEQIFAIVTTAKYWPLWNVSTESVRGAIEAPIQLGDIIHEQINVFRSFGDIIHEQEETDWEVTELYPPRRVVLTKRGAWLNGLTITYHLRQRDEVVDFTRELEINSTEIVNLTQEDIRSLCRLFLDASFFELRRLAERIYGNHYFRTD